MMQEHDPDHYFGPGVEVEMYDSKRNFSAPPPCSHVGIHDFRKKTKFQSPILSPTLM